MTSDPPPKKRNRKLGPGYSARQVSFKTGMPVARILRAMDRGEIRVVSFGGVARIPESELERIKKLYD